MLPVTPNLPKFWRPVRRFLAVLAVSCVLAAIYTSTGVQAQSTISSPQVVWYLFALPPAHILSGPDTDQGFADSEVGRYSRHPVSAVNCSKPKVCSSPLILIGEPPEVQHMAV